MEVVKINNSSNFSSTNPKNESRKNLLTNVSIVTGGALLGTLWAGITNKKVANGIYKNINKSIKENQACSDTANSVLKVRANNTARLINANKNLIRNSKKIIKNLKKACEFFDEAGDNGDLEILAKYHDAKEVLDRLINDKQDSLKRIKIIGQNYEAFKTLLLDIQNRTTNDLTNLKNNVPKSLKNRIFLWSGIGFLMGALVVSSRQYLFNKKN